MRRSVSLPNVIFGVFVGAAGLGIGLGARSAIGSAPVRPQQRLESGRQMVFILIGSLACKAHQRPGFVEAVESVRSTLRQRAEAEGARFAAVAVALDWSVEDGLEFVRKFAPFDEAVLGHNWLNSGAVRYVWRDLPGPPSVPQVVLIERDVVVTQAALEVSSERLIARRVGVSAIMEWQARAELP